MDKVCIVDAYSRSAQAYIDDIRKSTSELLPLFIIQNIDLLNQDIDFINHLHKSSICIVIGGDGFALKVLRFLMSNNIFHIKIYGVNAGTVGFLLNEYKYGVDLLDQIEHVESAQISPLRLTGRTADGESMANDFAFNEVSILRKSGQAVHMRIYIDEFLAAPKYIGDGLIIATPVGSTAYNFGANGPIIPLQANVLAITPLAPFRPRRWSGAILEQSSKIKINILSSKKRPARVSIDGYDSEIVNDLEIVYNTSISMTLLFSWENTIRIRTLKEQFHNHY